MSDFPYPGLRPFMYSESDIFFGRDGSIKQLSEKLDNYHFAAVVGNSGCGKSSLIQAELLPHLHITSISGREHWRVVIMRPGSQPFLNMAAALLKNTEDFECATLYKEYLRNYRTGLKYPWIADDKDAISQLNWILQEDLRSSYQKLEYLLPSNHSLLIVVDQFEELFNYAEKGNQQQQEVNKFIRWLLMARTRSKIYIVITMRVEFLDACAKYDNLTEIINGSFFQVSYLNQEQLREAIMFPAKICGGEIEPLLVKRLLDDVKNMGLACRPDQLPLLQFVLAKMWLNIDLKKVLTLDYYEKIGGNLSLVLTQTADQIYNQSTDASKKVIEILFRRISQKNSIYKRHPVKLSEIEGLAQVERRHFLKVTARFYLSDECDFLFAQNKSSFTELQLDDMVDIRHESIIRQWKTLKHWADDEAEWANFYKYWEKKALLWNSGQNALWRDIDLKNAEAWITRLQRLYPTSEQLKLWASRYGQHFDLAWKFLNESRETWRQEQEIQKDAEQHALGQQQILVTQKEEIGLLHQERSKLLKKIELFTSISFALKVPAWQKGLYLQRRLSHLQRTTKRLRITIAVLMFCIIAAEFVRENYNAILIKQLAEKTEQIRTESLFESYRRHAVLNAKSGDYAQAQQTLQQSLELDAKIAGPSRHARKFLASFLDVMRAQPQHEFKDAKAILYAVALSPDKQKLAAVGENGTVVLFDKNTSVILQRFTGHTGNVKAVVFDPKNQWLATAGEDKQMILWSLTDGKPLKQWTAADQVMTLAIDLSGEFLFSAGRGKAMTMWNAQGKNLKTILLRDSVKNLTFSRDNTLLAVASNNVVSLWRVSDWQKLHELKAHADQVQAIDFSPDGKLLATASDDGTVRLWDVESGKNTAILRGHSDKVFSVAFTEDGRYVISGSADTTMRMWEINSGVTVRVFQGHIGYVTDLVIDGKQLYSSSTDSTIKQWNLDLPHQYTIDLTAAPTAPTATAIAPDGQQVAVGFENGTVELHSLPEGQLLAPTSEPAHTRDVQRLVFSNDGRWLASASLDNTAKLWQVEQDKLTLRKTISHQSGVNGITFSPDNKRLLTASYDGKMSSLNLDSLEIIAYPLYEKEMNSVVWDAKGDFFLTTSDNQAYLWKSSDFSSATTLKPSFTYPPTQDTTFWAALSPDAQQTALVGRDFLVRMFPKQAEPYVLQGHKDTVLRAEFSPDGQQLATVSGDNTVRFWDLLQRSELFTINLPTKGKNVIWDFDFQCIPNQATCWVAVPLSQSRQLVLYQLNQ